MNEMSKLFKSSLSLPIKFVKKTPLLWNGCNIVIRIKSGEILSLKAFIYTVTVRVIAFHNAICWTVKYVYYIKESIHLTCITYSRIIIIIIIWDFSYARCLQMMNSKCHISFIFTMLILSKYITIVRNITNHAFKQVHLGNKYGL